MRQLGIALGCVLMIACAGKAIDVAPVPPTPTTGATSGSGTGGVPTPTLSPLPTADDCVAQSNAPIIGTWKGYVEAMRAPWDSLLLVIHGAVEGGAVCGTLTVGSGTPPAPAKNPNVGYPPGAEIGTNGGLLWPVSGVVYTLLYGTLAEGRLRFGIGSNELWRDWCALQTPVADEENKGRYTCCPNWAFARTDSGCLITNPATGQGESIDCGKFLLCSTGSTCDCDTQRCQARLGTGELFDVHMSGGEADGSKGVSSERVRFFRSE